MSNKDDKSDLQPTDSLAEAAGIFEWLLLALILALLFRAFIMEAYRIPTGSMAETLNGAHFQLCCRRCGERFDHGFDPSMYGLARDTLPPDGKAKPLRCRCPSCGCDLKFDKPVTVSDGDRILVLKCLYQFRQPKRWDVVVFKDPQWPIANIIKRLIAKPRETVEIIDGDIYINGMIAHKPKSVQSELWMTVYDNDYCPADAAGGFFGEELGKQPFRNIEGSNWRTDTDNPTKIVLNGNESQANWLTFDSSTGNDFRANYAYNDAVGHSRRPYCSDLMVSFSACGRNGGQLGAELSKYGIRYRAWIDEKCRMVIGRVSDGNEIQELASRRVTASKKRGSLAFSFANIDHFLMFELGKNTLKFDLGRQSNALGPRHNHIQPEVKIFATGAVELSHLAIFRDIHYTVHGFAGTNVPARAAEGSAFVLADDEFFVLGDNSTNSYDCRWWEKPGTGNNGITYTAGVVPREYLVGKAVFVYWPGGYQPFEGWPAMVPNIGGMRFIYGGSNEKK